MKKLRSKKLCASSFWLGIGCEDIIVFQLQNLTIEEQRDIVRLFAAPDFDQKRRSSSVVASCNGKVMMPSHAVIWVNCTEHTTDWFVSIRYIKVAYANSNRFSFYDVSYVFVWTRFTFISLSISTYLDYVIVFLIYGVRINNMVLISELYEKFCCIKGKGTFLYQNMNITT